MNKKNTQNYKMFQLVEKDGHQGIFIGEVEDKPVVFTLQNAAKIMDWDEAMDYAHNHGLRLPSKRELLLAYIHKEKLNQALEKVCGAPLKGWYWSSSEYNDYYAWVVYPSGFVTTSNKDYGYGYVRCVLA